MKINVHVTMTPFRTESRLLKESESLIKHGVAERVVIIALHEGNLAEHQHVDDRREVWRIRLRSRRLPRNLFVQVVKYAEYAWVILRFSIREKISIVNVHSLDLLPIGVLVKWATGARLIYDTHELETEVAWLRGMRKWVSQRVEALCIRLADMVVVVSHGIAKWYRNRYDITNVVTVLNCPKYRSSGRTDQLRRSVADLAGRRIILYQGGLVRGRGIEELLKAFEGNNVDDLVLVFLGSGELEDRIRAAVATDVRIKLLPAVAPEKVLEYTASADFGISIAENICLSHYYCLPNKFFEYIMAGVPVIVSDLAEMRSVVSRYDVGAVIKEVTIDAIREACHKIDAVGTERMAANLARAAIEYSWENQEKALIGGYSKFIMRGQKR